MVRGTDIDQFIVLNSSFNTWDRTFLRFDRVSIFNLKGDEINYFDFFESRDQLLPLIKNSLKYLDRATYKTLQQPGDFLNVERSEKFRPVFYEFSHANSVYKISANRLSKKNPAFAEGNYIVNAAGINLVFILDKNLKKVLWSLESVSDFIHDVQVTPEGELLYFNNTFDSSYSSIELLDPISLRRTILFNGNAENKFRAESQGSVQRLPNGNYLVSKFDPRESQVLVIGEKGQIIATRYPKSMGSTGYNLDGLQEVKKLDLELFLKNNKPLF